MPSPRAPSQADRAVALGLEVRRLRRAQRLTQRQVASRVPMSAGNLSRIENGDQGPPSDETIARLASALDADAAGLLKLAGRAATTGFEQTVLDRLDSIQRDIRAVKSALRPE